KGIYPEATKLLNELRKVIEEEKKQATHKNELQSQKKISEIKRSSEVKISKKSEPHKKVPEKKIEKSKSDVLKEKLAQLQNMTIKGISLDALADIDDQYQELHGLATELNSADYFVARGDFNFAAAREVADKDQAKELCNKALIDYSLAIKIKP